jgi:hypothetical protein
VAAVDTFVVLLGDIEDVKKMAAAARAVLALDDIVCYD